MDISRANKILIYLILFLIVLFSFSFYLKDQIGNKISQFFISKPGTCLILEQKYCGTGDKVLGFHAGFNIPAGVPLFAPFDGYIISSSGKFSQSGGDYHQVGVYVSPDGNYQKSTLLVDLTPAEPIVSSGPVKKGQLIGKTTGTVVSEAGGRNLLVSASTAYGLPDTGFEKSLLEKLLTKI